jgi:hypothetical protein
MRYRAQADSAPLSRRTDPRRADLSPCLVLRRVHFSNEANEVSTMTEERCAGCGRTALMAPPHGPDKGGPVRCAILARARGRHSTAGSATAGASLSERLEPSPTLAAFGKTFRN